MRPGRKMERIGILGGTFDPVHLGHLAVARTVRERYDLDLILFIPAPSPPHKDRELTPFAHRMAMLEAALADDPGLRASPLEAERPPPSYTIETLEELHRRLPGRKLYLVIGADMFVEIELWYRYAEIFLLADLIVAARPGFSVAAVTAKVEALPGRFRYDAERRMWHREDGFRIFYVPDIAVPISSSEIRKRLARGGSVDKLLPAEVLAYIRHHGLYARLSRSKPAGREGCEPAKG